MPGARFKSPKEQNEIIRLYTEEGLTAREIGNHFNAATTTITRLLRKLGVKVLSNSEQKRLFTDPKEKEVIARMYSEEGL